MVKRTLSKNAPVFLLGIKANMKTIFFFFFKKEGRIPAAMGPRPNGQPDCNFMIPVLSGLLRMKCFLGEDDSVESTNSL